MPITKPNTALLNAVSNLLAVVQIYIKQFEPYETLVIGRVDHAAIIKATDQLRSELKKMK